MLQSGGFQIRFLLAKNIRREFTFNLGRHTTRMVMLAREAETIARTEVKNTDSSILDKHFKEYSSGTSIATLLSHDSGTSLQDVIERLVSLAGPDDPATAKKVSPNSIRAKLGIDRIRNAIYCSKV